MSFGEHLDELRTRLIHTLVGLVVIFAVSLYFGGPLLAFLSEPLLDQLTAAGQARNMLTTSPLEGFAAYIKVATVATLVVGMPWILFQFWKFVSPGLYPHEQRFVYFLIPLSGVLTMVGFAVLYAIILPISLYFLITFSASLIDAHVATIPMPEALVLPQVPSLHGDPRNAPIGSMWINDALGQLRVQVSPDSVMGMPLVSGGAIAQQYRVSEYINLIFMLGLGFSIAFQTPLVLLLLSWAGVVDAEMLTAHRKQVILGCVVAAALLPTQDPWSLVLLSVMLIALFELGILMIRVIPVRRVAGAVRTAPSTDADAEA